MLMGQKAISTYSYQEYLEIEKNSDQKWEFHDGFITAMAGGTPEHGQISLNILRAVGNALESAQKPCITYSSDVRVHIEASRRSFYPDGSVVCDKPERSPIDKNALVNPILIIEVLSETTAEMDRGTKFTHYRKIPTLREYVLVSQTEAKVDTYYRLENGTWEIHTIEGLDTIVKLKSLGLDVPMKAIYRMVEGIDKEQGKEK